MSRITNDDSMKNEQIGGMIENPIIVIHRAEDAQFRYILNLAEIDARLDDPRIAGIMLSDLLDHIAAFYASVSSRDERDVRSVIFKVMRDEDRFKEKDPTRGNQRGATIYPHRN